MAGIALMDPSAIIAIAQLCPGMRVADFGAGRTGHVAIPLARAVGESGVVYAVDIHPEALSMLRGHRSLHSIPSLVVTRGDIERFGGVSAVAERSLDRVFIVNTLWTTRNMPSVIAEARRLLAPGGVIVVVDWAPESRHPVAPMREQRRSPGAIDRAFQEGGCARCGVFRPSQHHFGRIYSA